jgi:oligoribonuclease NrnB/cAMP/cGMP phosphodiesterase (DHH superfamily)
MSKEKFPTSTEHPNVCLWHANCMDGQIAAALMHRFFRGKIECVAVRYNEPPPLELMRGKHVYLVDFTYPVDVLLPHLDSMASLNILDHHKDAMADWQRLWTTADSPPEVNLEKLYVKFDNDKSGAMLVWDFTFGVGGDHPLALSVPKLVRYAQAYDLWTKELHMTDEVQSALRYNYPPHLAKLDELASFLFLANEADIEELKDTGKIILDQERVLAESLIRRSLRFETFLGYENVAVCQMPAELVNQAGEMIYTRHPEVPFVVLFEDNYKHQSRKYSFRSHRDLGMNVSKVAAMLGGKGHKNSAGATVNLALVFEAEAMFDIVE